MKPALYLALLFTAVSAEAQFSSELIQNNTYWGDGKAEYDIYDGQIMRYGQPRSCEVIHIIVREPFDPKQFVKPEGQPREGAITVLKLNQILHFLAGLELYQQMHSSFWRVDNSQLFKWSLTSNDSCGNTYKEARRIAPDAVNYDYRTYWDNMAAGQESVAMPANAWFYDELPWRVRTLDFRQPRGTADIQLAPSVINSKKDTITFRPAKISYTSTDRTIDVTVQHAGGSDKLVLDRNGPYLMREWAAANGSRLKMKRTMKVDYWNYNKNGDRERALNNPMLRPTD